jgi:hypothetical protein
MSGKTEYILKMVLNSHDGKQFIPNTSILNPDKIFICCPDIETKSCYTNFLAAKDKCPDLCAKVEIINGMANLPIPSALNKSEPIILPNGKQKTFDSQMLVNLSY